MTRQLSARGMVTADVSVDVTDSCRLGRPLSIVATVFLPPPESLSASQPVLFAVPGGGYSRGYFDMHFPGHDGYSQAAHHVAQGLAVVSIDPLGAGGSTPDVSAVVRIEDIAAANDLAVRMISDRLSRGDLVPGYPPVDIGNRIGIGQSMGGGVTIITAGVHHTYDAIAVLGWSAIHTVVPQRCREDAQSTAAHLAHDRSDAPETLSVRKASEQFADFLYPFFWEDVPAEIVAADTQGGYPIRDVAPAFGSKTLQNCVVAMLSPGYVSREAEAVSVPVFIGLGERDTAPEPHREPSAYTNSSDVTLFICERMAHMHNFASTRDALWDRLVRWCASL